MYKRLVSLILLFIITSQQTVLASPITFEDCMTQLNNEIQKDIKKSFPLLEQFEGANNAQSYNYNDISKMILNSGKRNKQIESLMALFYGTSIGDRELIVMNNDIEKATSGYLFYKELNGTNVLLEIKKEEKSWKVINKRKVQGKYVTLEQINKECVKKH
ncbi:hypothetical protein HFZ78_19305 [Priestia megaterium]|uniref:DUF3828 domain-containing protein n=1 Tax=Priestia megaterium TaxID=1404 RepID=A0A6H1P4W9_PRIMG|nr:hypothetical protein [Priestia megaterium]QIZ08593.1 hypothetical protein HFZ78_19305 [Priestia megaterium]